MQRLPFATYILMLTVGWMQLFAVARERLSPPREGAAPAAVARLERRVRELDRTAALEHEALLEFRQNVATLMPDAVRTLGRGREGYPVRALASVVVRPVVDDQTRAIIAKTLFESGRKLFEEKKYARANAIFEQITTRYGYTSYVVESYFLLAEGLYLVNELERSVTVINRMMELFPSDEMTGFAMIRLGRIYQERRNPVGAIDVYRVVMRTFPQRDVAAQAKESLRGVDL